jgi:hypothetical protein
MRIPLYLADVDFTDMRYPLYYGPEMLEAAKKDNAGHAPWITMANGKVLGQT